MHKYMHKYTHAHTQILTHIYSREVDRLSLHRHIETVSVPPHGSARVKFGVMAGTVVTAQPEYEDVRVSRDRSLPPPWPPNRQLFSSSLCRQQNPKHRELVHCIRPQTTACSLHVLIHPNLLFLCVFACDCHQRHWRKSLARL